MGDLLQTLLEVQEDQVVEVVKEITLQVVQVIPLLLVHLKVIMVVMLNHKDLEQQQLEVVVEQLQSVLQE
tara:strand:+ start:461 stop:670 length:210 start_codon:yes stop_codon:yes gene_type:complete